MSEQKCKCCDQFECNCPERCTNQKQDGIEERATEFTRYFALLDKYEEDERLAPLFSATGRDICVEFARTETATITAENNRLRTAVLDLLTVIDTYDDIANFDLLDVVELVTISDKITNAKRTLVATKP